MCILKVTCEGVNGGSDNEERESCVEIKGRNAMQVGLRRSMEWMFLVLRIHRWRRISKKADRNWKTANGRPFVGV